jgi:hypothetical protein
MTIIKNHVSQKNPAYYSINAKNLNEFSGDALEEFCGSLGNEIRGHQHSDYFADLRPGISGKPGLTRRGYEYFRSAEAIPTKYKDIVNFAEEIYHRFGIIQNIIDLMGDFVSDGVRLSHPSLRIQKFYQDWFRKVKGVDRSERFANNLYRSGTVVIRSQNAKVPFKHRQDLFKGQAADVDLIIENPKIPKKVLPWQYTFLHPLLVNTIGGDLSGMIYKPTYVIDLSNDLRTLLESSELKLILKKLPKEVQKSIRQRKPVVLPDDKTFVYYYRKDDWQERPIPMLYGIFKNIIMLEKLFLADQAALDGATSKIRVWKLGSLDHKIAPRAPAVAKLNEILQSHTGGGVMDVIWDDAIDLIESNTDIHEFLGEEKYRPHLQQIYAGMGIPPTLTGTGNSTGTTNNFISLKTFLRRLRYAREKLVEFWNRQSKIVQKAMGFREPAKVEFKYIDLSEEGTIKALLIQMSDRNLISDELLQYEFDYDPELERIRIVRENKDRKKGKLVQKAGPYYDPQFDIALKKIALQQGHMTFDQVGLVSEPGTEENETLYDLKIKESKHRMKMEEQEQEKNEQNGSDRFNPENTELNQQKGQIGRPRGTKDKKKRKKKEFQPVQKASMNIWIDKAQDSITRLLRPYFLKHFDKSDLRQLTAKEYNKAKIIKFGVLSNIRPYTNIDQKVVFEAISKSFNKNIIKQYNEIVRGLENQLDRSVIYEECKKVQALVYMENLNEDYS